MRIFFHLILFFTGHSMFSQDVPPWVILEGDSIMNPGYVDLLCRSAREKVAETSFHPELEWLIAKAAGTVPDAADQKIKVDRWWRRYGINCNCAAEGRFPEGNFLRQAFHSDFRLFVNIIGPHGRMELDTSIPDPVDGLLPIEYVDQVKKGIEEKYHHDSRRFQKDETWKNFMFYYMMLSEFRVR